MNLIKNIFLITLPSILFLLIALELMSRVFFPGSQAPRTQWDDEYKLNKFSQEKGKTGLRTMGNLAQQKARWRINDEGWNSPVEYYKNKDEGVKRIAVIGDSYVEAYQVDIEKSFPYVLSDELGSSFESYSFGMSGAPLSEYLNISRYVEAKFSPDIYIFTLVHNDFYESLDGLRHKPIYMTIRYENGDFTERAPSPVKHIFKDKSFLPLLNKYSLVRYLRSNLGLINLFKKNRKKPEEVEMNIIINDIIEHRDTIEKITYHILKTIKSELEGKELIFIMDAPRWSIYDGEPEKAKSSDLNNMTADICSELDLTFIDLTPHMIKDFNKNKKRYETDYDGHWHYYGHEFVAEILYDYIKKLY